MRELDQAAVAAVDDPERIESFIRQHESFILRCAARTAGRYISRQDDEWSVALSAFYTALQKYDYQAGSFLAFAQMVIRRKLIDHYRSQARHESEVQVEELEESCSEQTADDSIRLEIEAIAQPLGRYGIQFMDLADCSPRARKTRAACAKAVSHLLHNPLLINELRASRHLPLKALERLGIPRKGLERHRKYIIAAAEILSGDYPCLAEYLSYIRKEEQE